MPSASIQCQTCGTRQNENLNEVDMGRLESPGYIARYCRRCAGNTRWISRGTSSFEGFRRKETAGAGEASEALKAKRVLLIDDDEGVLAVLGKVLRSMELELDVAHTGREAALKLGREDYDLILSDIRMPDLDGTKLFEFLDQNLPEYRARVIFLTGDTGNPETMDFLQKSNCPYLTKPVEIPVLLGLLHHYFTGSDASST